MLGECRGRTSPRAATGTNCNVGYDVAERVRAAADESGAHHRLVDDLAVEIDAHGQRESLCENASGSDARRSRSAATADPAVPCRTTCACCLDAFADPDVLRNGRVGEQSLVARRHVCLRHVPGHERQVAECDAGPPRAGGSCRRRTRRSRSTGSTSSGRSNGSGTRVSGLHGSAWCARSSVGHRWCSPRSPDLCRRCDSARGARSGSGSTRSRCP